MNKGSLIVSLHDVAPDTFPQIRRQFEELTELGVEKMSLLVVPFYHSRKLLSEDAKLSQWLCNLQAQGQEIVLHGWLHRLPDETSEKLGLKRWFFENIYTSREAEFLNLSESEASQRMDLGLAELKTAGLKTKGFIAPAWLMNPQVEKSAKDHGLLFSNTISELIHLPTGKRIPTQSCVWSCRSAGRRVGSLLWNPLVFKRLRPVDPMRISLHPCDLEYPAIWVQIKSFITKALRNRSPTTYGLWINLNTAVRN